MRRSAVYVILAGVALAVAAGAYWSSAVLEAQSTRPGGLIRHDRGQSVSPVYEGWYHLPDGSIAASFGYFNRNYEEQVHIPIGPDNLIQPGDVDRGQPTWFYPRRQVGVVVLRLPADTAEEYTWTLTARGETMEIPVNLDNEYRIEPMKAAAGRSPGNVPPTVRFDAADEGFTGPAGETVERTAAVGTPLELDVWLTDDGLGSGTDEPVLTVMWKKFRGTGPVTFGEESPTVEGGHANTTATFAEPGDYILLMVAGDGSRQSNQCCWTNGYVRVSVAGAD